MVFIAVKAGAKGIVVSNHGGRQMDGSPSSISVLHEIVQAGLKAFVLNHIVTVLTCYGSLPK